MFLSEKKSKIWVFLGNYVRIIFILPIIFWYTDKMTNDIIANDKTTNDKMSNGQNA